MKVDTKKKANLFKKPMLYTTQFLVIILLVGST